jgi:AraC-like DNA-binding protein
MAASEPVSESVSEPVREQVSESVTGRPAPALRPFIGCYSGYRQAGIPPALHLGLPSPYLTLIFTIHEPLTVLEHPDPHQGGGDFLTLAGGLHTVPALISHDGRQSGIQLPLSPLGARALLGVPAGELAHVDVHGTDVLGGLATDIQERLGSVASWPARFAVLDELLLGRLRASAAAARPAGVSPEIGYAWQRLMATGGQVPVAELAGQTGWSDRHLRARFSAEIGLTPKTAARMVRFHRARMTLQRRYLARRRLDLAGLAASFGYYDQAHLDQEFRSLAGRSPTAWLAQDFRNFRASGPAPERG